MAFNKRQMTGQSVVEYLLLLAIVGVLAFLAMKEGGMVDQLEDKALEYYDNGAKKIKNVKD